MFMIDFFSSFLFNQGVVNPIPPEELPVDGNAWTTLSYGNGPGYDWGFRKDPNTVDTSTKKLYCAFKKFTYNAFSY